MTILLDKSPVNASPFPKDVTLHDALAILQSQLPEGRIVIKVEVDGQSLDGPALTRERSTALGSRSLSVATADQKDLSLTMLGKLAALIDWLAPQHKQVASLLEQG